jgi:hypothetical protein
VSAFEVGSSVRWDEAVHLARSLFKDPSSWVFAAVSGWDRPLHPLEPILSDTYDVTNQKFVKQRVKPYPRHWLGRNRLGGKSKGVRSSADVRRILRRE